MYKFFDFHCDTLTKAFENGQKLLENDLHINIKNLNYFESFIQVFAIWLDKKYYRNAYEYTNKVIDFYEIELEENIGLVQKILHKEDLDKCKKLGKVGSLLAIEGGESLEGKLENIEYFYNKGVRILTLCWNYENELGYGVLTKSGFGLKDFGKNAVEYMNNLNMIVDVSHLNEAGFWDLYNISKKPFIATHSNVYSICEHIRNLKDEQLKAIAKKDGLVGINFYPYFLTNKITANIEDILNHLDYLINLVGVEHICLGGDLDGIEVTPDFMKNVLGYETLFQNIYKKYGVKICEKICFENSCNFLKNFI